MEKTDTDLLTSQVVAELFRTGEINTPGLTFKNPELSAEQKAEMAEAIHQAKHQAKNITELLEGGGMLNGRDYTNKPFQISAVEWRASTITGGDGLPFFALLTIVDGYGEERKLAVGAKSAVESIALGDVKGFFQPIGGFAEWVKFVAVPLTDSEGKLNGNTAIELHTAEAPYAGPKSSNAG